MKRALLFASALAGCALREPRTTASAGAPCSTSKQCGHNVCFLGECRPAASSLSQVLVAMQPPNDSPFAGQQASIDLRSTPFYNFKLEPPYAGSGSVKKDPDTPGGAVTPVASAAVTFTDRSSVIPDQVPQINATTDASGNFSVRVPKGVWDVVVVPPPPSPPYRTTFDTTSPNLDLHLPAPLKNVAVAVTLPDGGPFPGAGVTAVDSVGGLPVSATAVAPAGGTYTLVLPPVSPAYLLQVAPAADAGTPATAAPLIPTYTPLPQSPTLTLPLPPEVTLSGRVVDAAGAPVSAAAVYARSDGNPSWTLSRSAITDPAGAYSLTVLAGTYALGAAPATGDPSAVSSITTVTAPPATVPNLNCPPKVRRAAVVRTSDGRPGGPGYQVIATRAADKLLTTRNATTTPTDESGLFHLVADPGVYRVEIVPPASSGLARTLVGIELPPDTSGVESPLPSITLSPTLNVVGTLSGRLSPGAPDTKVSGATLSFFALDTQGRSVFLGSALSDVNGQFKAALPDVQNPGP